MVLVGADIQHDGDTNNKISFGTDTQDYQTGGSSRLDISDSGVRLGGANARVTTILDEDDLSSDSDTSLATQQSIKAYVDNELSGQIVIGTPTATTSGTSVAFASSLPTGIKRIDVIFNAVSRSGTSPLIIQIGDSGGLETSSYTSSAARASASETPATSSAGFVVDSGSGGASCSFRGIMTLVNDSGNVWIASGSIGESTGYGYRS